MKKINWKVLAPSLIIVYLVAFLGSLFTRDTVGSAWYGNIKPGITPPNWVFPIVWSIIFFLIAISLYLTWVHSSKRNRKYVAVIFGGNLIFNVFWTALYFGLRSPMAAFVEIILLWLSIILMIRISFKAKKAAGWLLIPYLLWVTFAAVLNYLSAF